MGMNDIILSDEEWRKMVQDLLRKMERNLKQKTELEECE